MATLAPSDRPRPHPVKGVLALRRITNRQIAIALAMSEIDVGRLINARQKATPRFRATVARLLREPESSLFRDEGKS